MKLQYHPVVVKTSRVLTQEERAGLRSSILEFGQRDAIKVWRDLIVDGRHRYEICEELGIEPKIEIIDSTELYAISLGFSLNAHRRHATPTELAFAAAEFANMTVGFARFGDRGERVSQEQAAEAFGVSVQAVRRAAKIDKDGTPELKEAVLDGTVTLTDAAKVAKEKPAKQRKAIAAVKGGESRSLAEAADVKAPPSPVVKAVANLRALMAGQTKAIIYGGGKVVEHEEYLADLVMVANAYIVKNLDRGLTFRPPTVEEVREFCQQNSYDQFAPEDFVAFYAAKGWKVGSAPMKDWRAACLTWQRRDRKTNKSSTSALDALRKEVLG